MVLCEPWMAHIELAPGEARPLVLEDDLYELRAEDLSECMIGDQGW